MNSRLRGSIPNIRTWIIIILAGILLLAGLLSFLNYRYLLTASDWSFFLTPWNALHLWLTQGTNPYSDAARLSAQNMLYGRAAVLSAGEQGTQFAVPLPSTVVLVPLGLLSYQTARILMMTMIEISLVLMVVLGILLTGWRPRWTTVLLLTGFALLWLPGLQAVVTADFRVVYLMLQLLVLWLFQVKRDGPAGILSAVAFSGPAMVFPLLAFLFVRAVREHRWNFLAGWLASLLVLTGLSFRVLPSWPGDWLRETLRWMMEEKNLLSFTEYRALLNPFSLPFAVSIAVMGLIVSYMLLEWRLARGKSEGWNQWTVLMTAALSQFLVFFPSISMQVMLLPVLCLVFSVWSVRRGKRAFWHTAGAVLLFLGFSWGWFYFAGEDSLALVLVPAAAAVVGLWWIRWWKLRDGLALPLDFVD